MAESYAEINFSTFTSVSAASNPVPVMVTSWPPFSDPVEGEILLTSDKVWNTYLKKDNEKTRYYVVEGCGNSKFSNCFHWIYFWL